MELLKEIYFIWRYEGLGWNWLHLFFVALLISFIVTPLCRAAANRWDILDYPESRKIHAKPTPRLGGVAIFAGFIAAIMVNFHFSLQLKGVLISSTLMLVMGLIDDVRGLPALWRLIGQALSVLILIQYDVFINIFPPGLFFDSLEWLLTFIWVLGITNAFNFMDGLNGLASGLGMVSCFAFLIISYASGQQYLGFLAAAMLGACGGFLKFNFPKASIFMGDSGSTFIGFFLASLGIMGEWSKGDLIVSVSCPILILSVFIFDMIYITISRIWTGKVHNFREWIEYTGKDHLHHRLIGLGLNPVQTVGIMCFMNLILAVSAIKIRTATHQLLQLEYLQVASVFVLISILMIAGRKPAKSSF